MEVTSEMIQAVREHECSRLDHSWIVIQELGIGPVGVVCSNCGRDSGLKL